MVMATTPSPQEVGREFVRQYYTMLHDAPHMLHRFYSSGSTFIHGGVDKPGHVEEPLVGQVEINKKIQQLAFKDCHTKIRQVDSQATIESAVVVQVTGELSNNGEPMRRFMQTFVLVPQTPKKYYVHNDIFRYQDEVYLDASDTESEEQSHEINNNNNVEYYQQQQQQQVIDVTSASIQTTATTTTTTTSSSSVDENVNYVSPVPVQIDALPPRERVVRNEQQQQQQQQPEPQVNGHQLNDSTTTPLQINGVSEETNVEVVVDLEENNKHVDDVVKQEVQQQTQIPEQQSPAKQEQVQQQQQPVQQPPQPTAPSSWAFVVNKNPSVVTVPTPRVVNTTSSNLPTTATTPVQQPQQQQQQQQQQATSQQTAAKTQSTQKENRGEHKQRQNNEGFNGTQFNGRSNGPRGNGSNSARASMQREHRNNTNDFNEDNARFGRYPDEQQVFVGNLHSDVTEAELLNVFNKYGNVIDVRINKSIKQHSDKRLPNYGFIVFDNKESVENLLNNIKTNLTYKDEKGNEHRLNIEEKRAKQQQQHHGGGGKQHQHRGNRSSSNGSKGGRLNDGGRSTGVVKRSGGGGGSSGGTATTINQNNQQNHNNNNNNSGRRP